MIGFIPQYSSGHTRVMGLFIGWLIRLNLNSAVVPSMERVSREERRKHIDVYVP